MAGVVNPNYITATGSGLRANGSGLAASAGKGRYLRGALLTPAAAACTLTVYDNTSAAGDPICVLQGVASGLSTATPDDFRIPLSTGLWCVLTGAGAVAILYVE